MLQLNEFYPTHLNYLHERSTFEPEQHKQANPTCLFILFIIVFDEMLMIEHDVMTEWADCKSNNSKKHEDQIWRRK